MTTVGYGDITPKTTEGKEVAVTVMLVGIGFATLLIGAVAERFFHREIEDVERGRRPRTGTNHLRSTPAP
jgi:voltage-gated potassium channel